MLKSTAFALKILDNMIWVLLAILVIINMIITPNFFTSGNLINIIYHSSILGFLILAQGLALISGHFDLSIESTLAIAPIIAVLTATKWIPGMNWFLAIILTLVVGALVGAFNGFCIAKLRVNAFLQTLSMLIILRGLALFLIPLTIYNLPVTYTYLGGEKWGQIPVAVVLMLIMFLVFQVVINKTKFGRYLLATGGNPDASYVAGINVKRILFVTFILSGVLAAVAGLVAAGRQAGVTNSMGADMVMLSFAGAVLGGVSLKGGLGSPIGMLGGALFMGVIDNSLILLGINVYVIYMVKGLLILAAVLLDQARYWAKGYLLQKEEYRKYMQNEEHQLSESLS